nr:unnamed protein product [Callosobruchus analis]
MAEGQGTAAIFEDAQLLKTLIRKRRSVKFRLTHFKKYLDAFQKEKIIDKIQITELKQKMERFSSLIDEFTEIQCQIESLGESDDDQFMERVDFENSFDFCTARAKCFINDFDTGSNNSCSNVDVASEAPSNASDSPSNASEAPSNTSLGVNVSNWDSLILFYITAKLPKELGKEVPTLEQFAEFIVDRADTAETVNSKFHEQGSRAMNIKGLFSSKPSCIICIIGFCNDLKNLSVSEKTDKVKQLRLCLNCLKPAHFSNVCRAKTCKKCNGKHHIILHTENPKRNLATPCAVDGASTSESSQSQRKETEQPVTATAPTKAAGKAPEGTAGPASGSVVALSAQNSQTFALGLSWDNTKDNFVFHTEIHDCDRVTKRSMLSVIGQLFDPMGLVSPCIIIAKIMLQILWIDKSDWDSEVSDELTLSWVKLRSELKNLNELKVKRPVTCVRPARIELHGFADASAEAYGAAVYIRSVDSNGEIVVNLLCAKSKVAPIKTISIPRLELCAALVLTRLIENVKHSITLKFEDIYCWTDSTVVLGWLKTMPNVLKTFIANRVSEIRTINDKIPMQWRQVPTAENPADIVSRGTYPSQLKECDAWWHGPAYLLKDKTEWPILQEHTKILPEFRKSVNLLASNIELFPFERFSSLTKLKRTVAYMLRFINNCKNKKGNRKSGMLDSTSEIGASFQCLVKLSQNESFFNEINDLTNKNRISKKTKHRLTKLIFDREHLKQYHVGPQALLAHIREQFWQISGKDLAKYVVKKCQHFWKRWNVEYVGELQKRKKWCSNDNQVLEPGTLVIIKQDGLPPMKWKLGRVLSVSNDSEGVRRVAKIKTTDGEVKQAFSKICPLPIDC